MEKVCYVDVVLDLIIGSDVTAREVLVTDEQQTHAMGHPHLARELEGGDSHLLVGRMTEPIGVYKGHVDRIVGPDGHVAFWQSGYQAGDYRGVLVPIGRLDKLEIGRVVKKAAVTRWGTRKGTGKGRGS